MKYIALVILYYPDHQPMAHICWTGFIRPNWIYNYQLQSFWLQKYFSRAAARSLQSPFKGQDEKEKERIHFEKKK